MEGGIARDSTRPDATSAKQVTIVVHCTGARRDMRSDNTVAKQYSGQAVQWPSNTVAKQYRQWNMAQDSIIHTEYGSIHEHEVKVQLCSQ